MCGSDHPKASVVVAVLDELATFVIQLPRGKSKANSELSVADAIP